MNEARYQRELIKQIKYLIPGCVIMKNDPTQMQGVPDLLILYNNTWAMLEVKMESGSPSQPNQEHYISRFSNMSFASFINPSNEERVLDELQSAFGLTGATRVS